MRPFRGREDQWEYDIRVLLTDGRRYRERKKSPARTKAEAERLAAKRYAHLLRHGPEEKAAEPIPLLREFAPRWLKDYCAGDRRLAPSTLAAYASRLDARILPVLGHLRLDQITTAEVSRLKAAHAGRETTTVNATLATLGKLLRVAVKWGILDVIPCELERVREEQRDVTYYTGDVFEELLKDAQGEVRLILLLGGEAGLRVGELQALQWSDVDQEAATVRVRRKRWRDIEGPTKGKRARTIDLTPRLVAALKAQRHLRGPYVFCHAEGEPYSRDAIVRRLKRAQRATAKRLKLPLKAGLVHILRHTFCSRLAAAGAPAVAIQELAGHSSLTTTQRYMHLSPLERRKAALLLVGESGETEKSQSGKSSKDS